MSPYRQLPEGEEVFLDHVAHFVPAMDAAEAALERLGFTLTPFTPQMTAGPDGALLPAGTGNRCIMLREGYIEVLTGQGDSPIVRQMRAALDRYIGLHLVAFTCADAEAAHARLTGNGFPVQPMVRLRRQIETEADEAELRFSVIRLEPGGMPEGRIQMLTHHTPEPLWQERWLDHPNGARRLLGTVIVSADPAEAAARFARFLDRGAEADVQGGVSLTLDRGHVTFTAPDAAARVLPGAAVPSLPFIAATVLAVDHLAATESFVASAGFPMQGSASQGRLVVPLPAALGGALVFTDSVG